MERDLDLLRELLFKIEGLPAGEGIDIERLMLPGYEREKLGEHLLLLNEEGLIVASFQWADNRLFDAYISRLTGKGHEFVKAIQDNMGWNGIKKRTLAACQTVGKESLKVAIGVLIQESLRRSL